MIITEALQLAKQLLKQYGLENVPIKLDNAKNRHGVCRYDRYSGFIKNIGLSRHYINLNEESKVRNTILHEIAHALTIGHGHDRVWKRKAIEIGCTGERCTDAKRSPGRYQATCQCGEEFHIHRKTKHFNHYRCSKCRTPIQFVDTRARAYA